MPEPGADPLDRRDGARARPFHADINIDCRVKQAQKRVEPHSGQGLPPALRARPTIGTEHWRMIKSLAAASLALALSAGVGRAQASPLPSVSATTTYHTVAVGDVHVFY